MPLPDFTPREVRLIRRQAARNQLNVRAWADLHECSLETVRRIARRETYRHIADLPEPAPTPADLPPEAQDALDALASHASRIPPQAPEVNALLDEMQARDSGKAEGAP